LLSKKATGARAREIDTDRLLENVMSNYINQMVHPIKS